jgi:hypothetical protein
MKDYELCDSENNRAMRMRMMGEIIIHYIAMAVTEDNYSPSRFQIKHS